MSEKEFDSRGFPIEYIKEATAWYMKIKGYTEARVVNTTSRKSGTHNQWYAQSIVG